MGLRYFAPDFNSHCRGSGFVQQVHREGQFSRQSRSTSVVVQNNMSNPYINTHSTKMRPSFVCYADILGYSALSLEAIETGKGDQFLVDLRNALSYAYSRIRDRSEKIGKESFYVIKVFTDNVVVGYPLKRVKQDYGMPELYDILSVFSEFQVGLASKGFFLRGGISYGELYMDDDIVFGNALIEAVNQDKRGGPPCISLAPSAIEIVRRQLGKYGDDRLSSLYDDLLEDADGTVFLNYLQEAFCAFPDHGIFMEIIDGHCTEIRNGLVLNRGKPDIRAKYEWLARYHNFICANFAESHPIPTNPDADEEYGAACSEAQDLENYLIDIQSLSAMPSRINLEPLD